MKCKNCGTEMESRGTLSHKITVALFSDYKLYQCPKCKRVDLVLN